MSGPDRRPGRRRLTGPLLATALCVVAVTGCGSAPAAPPAAVAPAVGPTSAATAAPLVAAASRPVRMQIPVIGVDTGLMDLGVQDDGTLEVPPTGFPAGWFTGAPTPGALGPAVIAGHVDWGGAPGVFSRLREVGAGDQITVDRADGSSVTFLVQRVEQFAKDAFPTAAVYGDLDHAGLRVITCGGAFDPAAHSYVDDVVVFADLVGVRAG